jgi:hypothetical protein
VGKHHQGPPLPINLDLYQEKEVVDLSVRYSINGKKEAWSNKKELLIKS